MRRPNDTRSHQQTPTAVPDLQQVKQHCDLLKTPQFHETGAGRITGNLLSKRGLRAENPAGDPAPNGEQGAPKGRLRAHSACHLLKKGANTAMCS